jgi:uncharacterized coiled-coil protein SlyX
MARRRSGVANLEERVTHLEGQAQSHDKALDGLRAEVVELRVDLHTGHAQLRSEMAQVRSEMAQMRGEMATRTDITDVRREMGDLRGDLTRRIDLLEAKVDRHFVWLTGIMVSGFMSVIGALVAVVFQLN